MEIYEAKNSLIDLSGLALEGRILDVGGGGEGIIARHSGDRVVVIDNQKEALQEAPESGLKIVMDARKMKFLNQSFDVVTCFYALMYMEPADVKKSLKEALRVLRHGGAILIWDAIIPSPTGDIFVAPLSVRISESETVTAAYGARWRRQSPEIILALCPGRGFKIEECREDGVTFFLCLRKTGGKKRKR